MYKTLKEMTIPELEELQEIMWNDPITLKKIEVELQRRKEQNRPSVHTGREEEEELE